MYEEFYGFRERPFQLTPDPSFFFESVTHKKALSYLGYGLNQGEGFVVITGEVGAGKSTLVAHLKEKLDHERISVGEVVTSALDGEEMIHVAARSFGLDVAGRDKAGALAAIENFLHEEARNGKRCLLIVDESQNLSIGALEELRMLSNFQLGAHPLLQTLLLGQPEFKQLISQSEELEQLRQRIIAAHHLDPMQPGEIEPYIRHRLEHVGWNGVPRIDRSLFNRLHRESGGIPRKVNQIMTRLLLLGAVEERGEIDAAMLETVIDEMKGPAPQATAQPAPPLRPAREGPAADAVAAAKSGQGERQAAAHQAGKAMATSEDLLAIQKKLAERDADIDRLSKELAVLREQSTTRTDDTTSDLFDRVEAIELRLEEQEQSLRHVMTMLIEFFETHGQREAA